MLILHRLMAFGCGLACAVLPSVVLAQDDDASDADAVSDEEMARILESLAADAPTSDAASAGSAPAGGGAASWLDMAFILDVAAGWYSDDETELPGAHDPARTGFSLQQLELSIGASVDPYLRFDGNLVFSEFGVEVEEAYATTLAVPGRLQLRAGQFLSSFGRANPTHPHTWHFVHQPLVLGKFFGGEASRGLGVEMSWLAPLPWFVELTGSATDAAGECCARSFFGADDLGVEGLEDLLYTTRLEQFWPLADAWSMLFGVSAQFGPNPTGNGNRTEIYGADLLLRLRPPSSVRRQSLSLQLEGMFRTRQVPDDVLQDLGGYAALVWQMSPRWEVGARYELVTGVDDDPLDPDWTSDRRRTALQGTFYPSHFSRLRLQLHHDDMTWRDEPVLGAILALEVLVGSHGAHSY